MYTKSVEYVFANPESESNPLGQVAAGAYIDIRGHLAPAVLGILPADFEEKASEFGAERTNVFAIGHMNYDAASLDIAMADTVSEKHITCRGKKGVIEREGTIR